MRNEADDLLALASQLSLDEVDTLRRVPPWTQQAKCVDGKLTLLLPPAWLTHVPVCATLSTVAWTESTAGR